MILAGEIMSAGRVAALQSTTYDAAATTDLTLSGTAADVVGATYTFDTAYDNASAAVSWVVDFDTTNTTAAVGVCWINVDGVDVSNPQAILEQGTANDQRGTRPQQTTVVLPTAGPHTIKLVGQRASGSGGIEIHAVHTTLRIVVTEAV